MKSNKNSYFADNVYIGDNIIFDNDSNHTIYVAASGVSAGRNLSIFAGNGNDTGGEAIMNSSPFTAKPSACNNIVSTVP